MPKRDLWPGADVRWSGPTKQRGGIILNPGDPAVVVDPERHHITSCSPLYYVVGTRPPRPSRNVVIELPDATKVRVRRRHLELVAPADPPWPHADPHVADWFLDQLGSWEPPYLTVGSLVPTGFEAVARVLHPWDDGDVGDPPLRWSVVAAADGFAELHDFVAAGAEEMHPPSGTQGANQALGWLDLLTASALTDVLGPMTTTPTDAYFAVWEGWGDVPVQQFPGAAQFSTPWRTHFVLSGPLDCVMRPFGVSRLGSPLSGMWWPADHAWFVMTEIDFAWTFVAGSTMLIDQILAHPDLEATRTRFDNPANRPENLP